MIGEYIYDKEGGRHQAFVAPVRDTMLLGETVKRHDRIHIEQSLKYSAAECDRLWRLAGLTELASWRKEDEYGKSHQFRISDYLWTLCLGGWDRPREVTPREWTNRVLAGLMAA